MKRRLFDIKNFTANERDATLISISAMRKLGREIGGSSIATGHSLSLFVRPHRVQSARALRFAGAQEKPIPSRNGQRHLEERQVDSLTRPGKREERPRTHSRRDQISALGPFQRSRISPRRDLRASPSDPRPYLDESASARARCAVCRAGLFNIFPLHDARRRRRTPAKYSQLVPQLDDFITPAPSECRGRPMPRGGLVRLSSSSSSVARSSSKPPLSPLLLSLSLALSSRSFFLHLSRLPPPFAAASGERCTR